MPNKSYKMVLCPFNSQHVMSEDRLVTHLVKCMKNYPEHFTCPYNALHRFLCEGDYQTHILNCPDRVVPVQWKSGGAKNDTVKQLPVELPVDATEENWDD